MAGGSHPQSPRQPPPCDGGHFEGYRYSRDRGILRAHRALRPGLGTEAAVYGTILVSGLVAVSSTHGDAPLVVLIAVTVTALVFWGAQPNEQLS